MREIQYREHLFDVLSSNVDEVFLIYNQEKDGLEYVSANSRRVLGIDAAAIMENADLLADKMCIRDRP